MLAVEEAWPHLLFVLVLQRGIEETKFCSVNQKVVGVEYACVIQVYPYPSVVLGIYILLKFSVTLRTWFWGFLFVLVRFGFCFCLPFIF